MYKTKFFKDETKARDFITKNKNKYYALFYFVENGFAVDYKKLKQIY